jgi:hypothetical protein
MILAVVYKNVFNGVAAVRLRIPDGFGPTLVVLGALTAAQSLPGQAQDSVRMPTGALIGHVVSSTDSAAAGSVELRLLFVDSSRTVKTKHGDSLEVFLDSLRTRVAVTDSTGAFAIRRVAGGHYLFRLRRIGYQPMDGVITVGDDTLAVRFVMDVTSQLLASVRIIDTPIDAVSERLKHVGWKVRAGLGSSHTFIDRAEILRRKRDNVGDILSAYGIHDGDFLLDRMPMTYDDIREYPAELVIGVEIYRHTRPVEFAHLASVAMPRFSVPSGGRPSTMGGSSLPLVVIWTYIPGGE